TPAALELLDLGLAVDAVRGDGPRHQATLADLLAAGDAVAVVPFVDPLQGQADLVDQLAVPVAQPEDEVAARLERGDVERVGGGLALVGEIDDRGPRVLQEGREPLFEELLEEVLALSVHSRGPRCWKTGPRILTPR